MQEQIEEFVEYLASQDRYSTNTIAAYRSDLTQFSHFLASLKRRPMNWAQVNSSELQTFLDELRSRDISNATIARKMAALRSFYFYLFENLGISVNPTLGLNVAATRRQASQPLTAEQVSSLLAAASEPTPKGYRDRAILEVLYATGLRVTELIDLSVRSLDWKSGKLHVKANQSGRPRSLPLTEQALTALKDYLDKGRTKLGLQSNSGPLFVNTRGRPLSRQGVWLIIKHYAKQSGTSSAISPHSLRHCFAAHRLAKGESLEELQLLLGHAHPSTTLAYRNQETEPTTIASAWLAHR